MSLINIKNTDCLKGHKNIPDKSIDLIYTDLPFNQTRNHWDSLINVEELWKDYKRIIKDNGAIILNGQGMFTALMMMSNQKMWRYNLVWKKGERSTGFLNSKRMPLRNHEDIMVFYKKLPTYNPQMVLGTKAHSRGSKGKLLNNNYGKYDFQGGESENGDMKYPKSIQEFEYSDDELDLMYSEWSILNFDRPHPPIHPTQKPVALAEWLIKTYSNEGDIILDSTFGCGTNALACLNTNRKFIGFELEEKYFNTTIERIKKHERFI